jgi:hypothetical protein
MLTHGGNGELASGRSTHLHIKNKTGSNCWTEGRQNCTSVETAVTIPATTRSKTPTASIKHIIALCGFPDDFSMVEIIQQEDWMDLTDVITLTLDDLYNLKLLNDDGNYAAKLLNWHVRKLKCLPPPLQPQIC